MIDQDLHARTSNHSRRLRSSTLLRIRWFAIFCQAVCTLFVTYYLGFALPIVSCLLLITFSAWLNLFLTFYYSNNHRLSPNIATVILAFDIIQLAMLLYLTGGLQNPFSILLITPAGISATSLSVPQILTLNGLVIFVATILSLTSQPLPWYAGQSIETPQLMIVGIWVAIVSSLLFTTAYAYRVAEETRRLADALSATELVLQREKHLSALDGLAAAAAHELGTPLATIQLVVKEMQHSLKTMPELYDDLALLRSQTERCRHILKRLTSLSSDGEEHLTRLKFSSLIEEMIAPLRDFGIKITTQKDQNIGDEPVFERNPAILYGLGNLLENAVDFAHSNIIIHYGWTEKKVTLSIIDDGIGFDPAILEYLGEPYMTSRSHDAKSGGLGLGLFIAKTFLERSGAYLRFRNRPEQDLGAEVYLAWPRKSLL